MSLRHGRFAIAESVPDEELGADIPAPTDEETFQRAVEKEGAARARALFSAIHTGAGGSLPRLGILIGLCGGCSLHEIGAFYGISKQGAQKHLDAAIADMPCFKEYRATGLKTARTRNGRTRTIVPAIIGHDAEDVSSNADFARRVRTLSTCIGRVNQNGTTVYSPRETVEPIQDPELLESDERFNALLREALK